MTSRPHLAFGLFGSAVVTSCFQMADPSFISKIANITIVGAATFMGSLAPDLDAPASPISRLLFFIAKPVQRRWPHRTMLHSLIGTVISAAIVYYLADFVLLFFPLANNIPFILCVFFLGGAWGHLAVDSLTVTGIKWLWPYQRAFAYPCSKRHRVRTGDKKAERYYSLLFLAFFAGCPHSRSYSDTPKPYRGICKGHRGHWN